MQEVAEVPPLSVPRYVRLFHRRILKFFENRCAAHSYPLLRHLPRYMRLLIDEYRDEGFSRDDLDLYLILGDLVTFPTARSFRFAREFLTQDEYISTETGALHKYSALGIPPQRLLLIPGNHDKLLQPDLSLYHRHITRGIGLPGGPAPRNSFVVSRTLGNRTWLFILIDASRYGSTGLVLDSEAKNHLAAGEVPEPLSASILEKLDKLKNGDVVDGLKLEGYEDAIKVLVAHYAVDDILAAGPAHKVKDFVLPHACQGLGPLVEALKGEIRLVLHGHLHVPQLYNFNGVPVVSAASTSQMNENNGFFVIKIYDTGEIRAEHHRWYGSGFLRDTDPMLNKALIDL